MVLGALNILMLAVDEILPHRPEQERKEIKVDVLKGTNIKFCKRNVRVTTFQAIGV